MDEKSYSFWREWGFSFYSGPSPYICLPFLDTATPPRGVAPFKNSLLTLFSGSAPCPLPLSQVHLKLGILVLITVPYFEVQATPSHFSQGAP